MTELSVLLVDDSELTLQILSAILEDAGWSVEPRDTPFLPAEDLESLPCHVVLLDLGMPGLTDEDLPFVVRSLRGSHRRAVVLHSAREEDELRAVAQTVGADGYLVKTHDEEVILETIRAAASRAGRVSR